MKDEKQDNYIKSKKGQAIQVINQGLHAEDQACHQQLSWALVNLAMATK